MMLLNYFTYLFEKVEGLSLETMQQVGVSLKKEREKINLQFLKDIENIDVLCVYGIDNEIYRELKPWLNEKKDKYLIFIEDEVSALKDLEEDLLKENKVKIYFLKSEEEIKELSRKICWYFSFLNIQVISQKGNTHLFEKLKESFQSAINATFLISSEYSDFGLKVFENTFHNLLATQHVYLGKNLKNRFKNIPAIICGAGPSIEKHLDLLKGCENKALIFAGGTALNVLATHLMPHIGGAVDKQSPYHSFKNHFGNLIPFFYQNRVSKENFSLVHHDPVMFGDNAYSVLQKWMKDTFELEDFNGGWNVSTFLMKAAQFLGCDPIIFIGLDLAYSEKQHYAQGVSVAHALKGNNHFTAFDQDHNLRLTQKDWVMARDWIVSFAKENPNTHFINATEGGLGFSSPVSTTPFKLVIDTFLKNPYDLSAELHSAFLDVKPLCIKRSKIIKELESLKKSLVKCQKISQNFFEKCKTENGHVLTKESILSDQKMKNKAFYKYILEPVWNVWGPLLERKTEECKGFHLEKNRMHQWIFLNRIMLAYQDLIDRIIDEKKAI